MAGIQAWLGEGILACCKYVGLYSCDEQQKPISCRLSLPDGLLRIGIVNEEPPYAEPHVRWCERSENEVGRKLLRFPPTRSILIPPLFIIILHITTHAVIIHIILRGRIKATHIIRLLLLVPVRRCRTI